uniref:flagellar assembly peptidoglycan hydrolase FlgJ n=1 Tax=Stenotrophomonas sp. YIM B06876 TaxID=3060211 RepID=UPI0027381FDC
ALPLPAALPAADPLTLLPGQPQAQVAQPMERALDLIAGRETSQMHEAIGRTDPYRMQAALPDPTRENWALANDRWHYVHGNQPGTSVDTGIASAAAEKLGTHTPEGFVASIWPHAERAARELGVNPRALVAQAALETGWGRKPIRRDDGGSAHNLFGIKANGWKGERATTGTHEYVDGVRRNETASFRAYASAADSFSDYVHLLKNSPRYQSALKAGGDVRSFAQGLQKAGYATDPSYAAKIAAIAAGPTIDRAVTAIGDAGTRLARSFASNVSLPGLGVTRR